MQTMYKNKVKNKSLQKAVHGKATAAYLKKWRKDKHATMVKDGVSAAELMEQLVPAVGSKSVHDPGKAALKEFMQLQKKYHVSSNKLRATHAALL
jgi:hypothetical protein